MADVDRAELDLSGVHVVVFGWAGSHPRQLSLIGRWYARRGGRPLVACAEIPRAMAWPGGWDIEGRIVADQLITRARLSPGPIVAHVFSNAGFWSYASTLGALEQTAEGRQAMARIAGVILDSTPGFERDIGPDRYSRLSSMAMMPILLGALGRRPRLLHVRLSGPLELFMRLFYHLTPRQRRDASESLDRVRRTGRWPFLMVYSKGDPLIPLEYVEAFAAELGPRLSRRLCFEDSKHVQHMLKHNQAYFGAVASFLSGALATG